MNVVLVLQLFIISVLQNLNVDGACTLPTVLNGEWWDSRTSTVTFSQGAGTLAGWSVTSYSQTVSAYTCVESDSSYWLFKSDNSLAIFGGSYHIYFCVKYSKITDYSYSYYLDSDIETNAGNERVISTSSSVTISNNCNPTSGPGVEEFHVLVQKDRQADVKQWFPDPLLGVFAYNVTTSSSSGICGTDSVWDGCTNRTTITFNHTQCATTMFGSSDGELYATKYFTSGSTTYVIIIDGSTASYQRFTCLAVSGTSVSSNPGSCKAGQNATARTSDANSVFIKLTAYETCPFTTSTAASSSSSSSLGIIIAVVIVLLLIIAAIVGFILFYKCYKKEPFPCQKSRVRNGSESNAEKPLPNDVIVEPLSPHNTVEVEGKKKTLPPIGHGTQPVPPNTRQ